MSNFNKNGWVSLAQICEERQLVIDAETGKKVCGFRKNLLRLLF